MNKPRIGEKKCQAWWWYYPSQDRGIREFCDQPATHNIKGELLCDKHYDEHKAALAGKGKCRPYT